MVSASDLIDAAWSRIAATAGGEERLRVVGLLGAVLGLDTADKGTISAVADQLEHAFHIGNTGFGLLLAAVSLVGAVGTLPMGVLADRVQRKTVLSIAIALWALAMIFSGLAQSYAWLLAMRVLLGIVTAAPGPASPR